MRCSLPFEIHPESAERAVLCLHGYTGHPGHFRFLAEQLAAAGLAVSVPRLPGAGTDMNDLSTTHRRDWMRRSYDSWLDLKSRYESVSIAGYSMGALLALILAPAVLPDQLILLAPALVTRSRMLALTPVFVPVAPLIPEMKTGWEPKDSDPEELREYGRRYWYRRDIRSAAQLALLGSETRRVLRRVETPVKTIVSRNDTTVPMTVLSLLEQRLPRGLAAIMEVENCGHDIPHGAEKEKVAKVIISWFDS
jgi:carboxylesterase